MTGAGLSSLVLPAVPAMLRVGGAALLAPAFTSIPGRVRAGLAVAAACLALPLGVGGAMPEGPWWGWAPAELMAGLCIGGVAAASVEAMRLLGRLAGEQMGLGLGEAYEPSQSSEANAVESLTAWAGTAAFVSVGGVEGVVLSASKPLAVTGDSWMLSATGIARTLDAAMQVGLRVCLPVLAVTLAGAVVGGVVVRAAPRTLTLACGFGARSAAALGTLVAAAGTAWAVQSDLVRTALRSMPGGSGW